MWKNILRKVKAHNWLSFHAWWWFVNPGPVFTRLKELNCFKLVLIRFEVGEEFRKICGFLFFSPVACGMLVSLTYSDTDMQQLLTSLNWLDDHSFLPPDKCMRGINAVCFNALIQWIEPVSETTSDHMWDITSLHHVVAIIGVCRVWECKVVVHLIDVIVWYD